MSCRICLEPNRLISPCLCRGSIGFIHKECLEKEIEHTGIPRCSICKFPYFEIKKSKIRKALEYVAITLVLEIIISILYRRPVVVLTIITIHLLYIMILLSCYV
jgi:E3 ubiquitin-protein ligase DOA10